MTSLTDVDFSEAQELGEGYRAIPPGEYRLYMESSEREQTKDAKAGKGDNSFLKCIFVVMEGEYENSKIVCRFNLWNSNPEAVRIARDQFNALCMAIVGQPAQTLVDSSKLHSQPFIGFVDNVPMTKDDPNSKRSNELLFRKGTIRSAKEQIHQPPAVQQANAGVSTQTAPVAQQQAASAPAAQAQPTAQPVRAGVGKPPWQR